MAVMFVKPTDTSVEIFWNFGDLETCGTFFSYRYTYTLRRNGTVYSTVGPTSTEGNSWSSLESGTYTVQVLVEQLDDTPAWVTCQNYFHSGSIEINTNSCIPSGATNIKFSDLAIHYGLPMGEIRLSGTNNPSTGLNIFGQSGLPASGTISRATPNAVSELRGICGGIVDNFNGWTVSLKYANTDFSTQPYGYVEILNYSVEWKNITTGETRTTCPNNSSSVTFSNSVNVVQPFQGFVVPAPYVINIRRNSTNMNSVTRDANSQGITTGNYTLSLNSGDSASISIAYQLETSPQCDTQLDIRFLSQITAAVVGGTTRPFVFPFIQEIQCYVEGGYCSPPAATTTYFRFKGNLSEQLSAGFAVDGNSGSLFFLVRPFNNSGEFVPCGNFENERPDIRQSNTTASIETSGSKTVKIGFSTSNLKISLTGTVTVKRLSDNAVVASAEISRSPGTNLYSNTTVLSWSNASNNTKIGIEVELYQPCIR